MVAPQTFALGSDWPFWGGDVCLELAVHRRARESVHSSLVSSIRLVSSDSLPIAVKEGWVPIAWEDMPDSDPDLVTHIECLHKTAEGDCCTFHVRVEVDESKWTRNGNAILLCKSVPDTLILKLQRRIRRKQKQQEVSSNWRNSSESRRSRN